MMKFLGDLKKVEENKYRVGLIHNMPFDPVQGFGKSAEELEQMGVLVDDVPEPQIPEGKQISGLFVNPATKEVWYEYEDKPLDPEERLQILEQINAQLLVELLEQEVL